jgi:hypothetical protein
LQGNANLPATKHPAYNFYIKYGGKCRSSAHGSHDDVCGTGAPEIARWCVAIIGKVPRAADILA